MVGMIPAFYNLFWFWMHFKWNYLQKARRQVEKSRVEWTGTSKSHHSPVNSDVLSGANENESYAYFFT